MVKMAKWLDRTFTWEPPADLFPMIVERLRGTPARLDETVRAVPRHLLTRRIGEAWSIQEHIGHLLDLEPLWTGRLDDFEAARETLRAADLSNRATYHANHNASRIEEILAAFRRRRLDNVARLEAFDDEMVVRTARHPRLKQPMRVIDLCLFVAEHDDHHLAVITEIWKKLSS